MSELRVDKVSPRSGTYVSLNTVGMKNIIINGDMSIDQRNDGASVTMGSTQYPVDRFPVLNNTSQAATNSMQRVADAPTGFKYSAKFTTGTGAAATASQQARFSQSIEGNNIINLSYGTASAKTLSLSFWVKASQTGTFGGSLRKDNGTRSYPFTYTISSASTWEYKTIVIPGDTTTGTWVSDNNASLIVFFDLGSGSNFLYSAGAWGSFNALGAAGGTSTVAVTGATWQITGVQLEAGTTASDFEFLPYDVNLQRCLRYYQVIADDTIVSGSVITNGSSYDSTVAFGVLNLRATMRSAPSIDQSSVANGFNFVNNNQSDFFTSFSLTKVNPHNVRLQTAETITITQGGAGWFQTNSNGYLGLDAEL